ncbi:MerR family transcriptional regulator [Arthrobacter sp. G119Y2]|uniref:MerR family transcriptional regulator n=1 Tax=Arthrobacter sp. G119Y2 TaxID=3134965 RepID=UPI003119F8F0
MRIGELAERTGATPRQLRFYESCGLLSATREGNNYRSYAESSVGRVEQIRGLLEAGLSTRMVGELLPCFDSPQDSIHFVGVTPEMAAELERERNRLDRLVGILTRNRDAVTAYLQRLNSLRDEAGGVARP